MRRSTRLLAFVGTVAFAPVALAQDTKPKAPDAGSAAVAAPSASATHAAPPAPPPPLVSPPSEPKVTEEEVFQLGRLVELEADRARGRRYVGSTMELVAAAGVATSGAIVFTLDYSGVDPGLVTFVKVLGGVEIGLGAGMAIDAVLSFVVASPMERMFGEYAPIAVDKSLSPAERVHRGEALLEAMAERERSARTIGVVTGLVSTALAAAIGIWFVADDDFWGNDPTTNVYRPIVGTMLGLSVLAGIGDAISKVLWDRGPAELAWEHWKVSHEPASVQTSRLELHPFVAPVTAGVMGGLRARF